MPSIDAGYPVKTALTNSTATTVAVTAPSSAGKLIVAVVSATNRTTGSITVSGLGLTWVNVSTADLGGWLSCGVWAAWLLPAMPVER